MYIYIYMSVYACFLVSTFYVCKLLYVLIWTKLYIYNDAISICFIILYQMLHSSYSSFLRLCSCSACSVTSAQLILRGTFYLLCVNWDLRQIKVIHGNLNSVLASLILQKFCSFLLMCRWLTFQNSLYDFVVARCRVFIQLALLCLSKQNFFCLCGYDCSIFILQNEKLRQT